MIGSDALLADPHWLPHQLDWVRRRLLFVRVTESEIEQASFLDERLLSGQRAGHWLELSALLEAQVPADPPRRWIFHIGHCGSTLLSRLLGSLPDVLALREPLPLRALAQAHEHVDRAESRVDAAGLAALRRALIGLLGRRWHSAQQVLVKATSSCNNLLPALREDIPQMRALAMWMPLETWLASLLKSTPARRDALEFAPMRLRELRRHVPDLDAHLWRLGDGEILALGWLAELARLERLQRQFDTALLMLDFHEFLAGPGDALTRIAEHLRLPHGQDTVERALAAPTLKQYAKAPEHAYSPDDRAHDLALAQRRFGKEIAAGMGCAERLLARAPQLSALAGRLR